ncbi:hypothetical protein NXZ62_29680, partial [Klebsiella grimontii]|uniref:hypothetical protein n=1 Tax=Klebsiella grimontii TaxID=2058152 RepID=UPI002163D45B
KKVFSPRALFFTPRGGVFKPNFPQPPWVGLTKKKLTQYKKKKNRDYNQYRIPFAVAVSRMYYL